MFEVIKQTCKKIPALKRRIYWGYQLIPAKVLLINWLFQRILRINSDCPWSVHYTSTVIAPERITIGSGVGKSFAVSGGCYIQAVNGVCIGDGTIFSQGVGIISANHNTSDLTQHVTVDSIRIGQHCWLGKNSIILPGVTLGDYCVVGANAVVTRSFGPGTVLGGIPAKELSSARRDNPSSARPPDPSRLP
jgi:acetyltransferase-like isoleucine patch superfamily enzyme